MKTKKKCCFPLIESDAQCAANTVPCPQRLFAVFVSCQTLSYNYRPGTYITFNLYPFPLFTSIVRAIVLPVSIARMMTFTAPVAIAVTVTLRALPLALAVALTMTISATRVSSNALTSIASYWKLPSQPMHTEPDQSR